MENKDYNKWISGAAKFLDGWRSEIVDGASIKSIKTNDGRGFNLKIIVDGKGHEFDCWIDAFKNTKFSELVNSIRLRGLK